MRPRSARSRFGHTADEVNPQEDESISRYRTGWDADSMAAPRESAADTRDSAASTRPEGREAGRTRDANWDDCAASETVNIANSL